MRDVVADARQLIQQARDFVEHHVDRACDAVNVVALTRNRQARVEIAVDDARYSMPLYLAAHGVEVWTMDYRTHFVPADAHGNRCCPHPATGPAISGSPNVMVNNQPALRVGDNGMHATCCGPNTWIAQQGSSVVLINMMQSHRLYDVDIHCGGPGYMIEASSDVFVGDGTEAGMSAAKLAGKALAQICG